MEITKNSRGAWLSLGISGKLDANTAPALEEILQQELDAVTELELDLKDMHYISSAGLRVLLVAQKQMMQKGGMRVINVSLPVMDVFEMTGFADILTIA